MNILFVCNRIPFPPNKGEKIRSFHLIKHLSEKHNIFLYSLCDSKKDLRHKKELAKYCSSVNLYRIHPLLSSLRALTYFFTKYPFTFAYFFSYKMKHNIKKAIRKEPFDMIFAYCSSSAQYIFNVKKIRKYVDFVDTDSDKWQNFSQTAKFPFSLIY